MAPRSGLGEAIRTAAGVGRWLAHLWPVLLGTDPLVACRLDGPMAQGCPHVCARFAGRRSRLPALDSLFRDLEEPAQVTEMARGWRAVRALAHANEPDDALLTERWLGLERARGGCVLRFHPYVLAHLAVLPSMEQQLSAVPSGNLRKTLTRIWRERPAWRVAQTVEEFSWFYDVLYRPFAEVRFRGRASIEPRASLEAVWRQRGSLLLVGNGPRPVTGALFFRPRFSRDTLYCWKSGFAVDARGWPREDYTAVLATTTLAFAVEQRARALVLGVAPAVLSDGVFQRNRRLGCDFTAIPGDYGFSLLLAGQRAPSLLWRVPLLAMGREGWEGWWGWCPPGSTAKNLLDGIGAALFPGLSTANVVGLDEALDPVLARELHRLGERHGARVRLWPEGPSPMEPRVAPASV